MQNEQIHKRERYSAEFKEKVALEALSGAKAHAQIASDYGISPDLVKDWKKQAREMLGECFRRGGRKTEMEKKDERIRINSARIESANAAIMRIQAKACGLFDVRYLFLKLRHVYFLRLQRKHKTPRSYYQQI